MSRRLLSVDEIASVRENRRADEKANQAFFLANGGTWTTMAALSGMSRRRFIRLAGAVGAATAAGLPIRSFAETSPGAGVDSAFAVVSADPAQLMQGFGAAGAWWPNELVRFRPEVREQVADLLFGPEGIGLSVYRYNIGGGGAGVSNPVRAPESFLTTPDTYDWSRDPGGRLFLQMAADRDSATGAVRYAGAVHRFGLYRSVGVIGFIKSLYR
jgi:hypothetical protein